MVDIIYSISCHEEPDCVIDMIQNIFYYNKDICCNIVVNTNVHMFDELKKRQIESPCVFLEDNPTNKRIESYDILKSHISNFLYCRKNAITSTFFIPLASNCMFHKPVCLNTISSSVVNSIHTSYKVNYNKWHWRNFFKNPRMIHTLESSGISEFYPSQHEGVVIPYDIMGQIVDLTIEKNLEQLVEYNTVFEEIILSTLYIHISGKQLYSLCKVFWNKPNYLPNINDIQREPLPCVKRVIRAYNDPIRVWIRTQASNYS